MAPLLLALALLSATPSTQAALRPEIRERVDALVHATMAHQHLPGLSLAIARGGDLLYARGYGYRDLTRRLPADATTVYNLASNTKQFTAAAIMLLQQQGKLKITDRVTEYFPEFTLGAGITLEELLTHTSGIPDYVDLNDLPHRATAKRFVDLVSDAPLDFPPGSRFEYSNTNYVMLGMIVEQVGASSYSSFLSRQIFDPLKMTNASTRVIPASQPDGALGYTYDSKVVLAPQTPDDLGYGDGTVNASVLDLVKWDAALDGGGVVDAASWQAMVHSPLRTGYGPRGGYGFGLDLSTLYGHREVSHEGYNVGFASVNATFPDDGIEIVALSNGDPFDEDLFVKRVFAMLVPPTAQQLAADLRSAPGEVAAITKATKRMLAEMCAGHIDPHAVTRDVATHLGPAQARLMCADGGVAASPERFVFRGWQYRHGVKVYSYEAFYAKSVAAIDVSFASPGKIGSIDIARED
jgi:CubicO group peptidase (beta-lactamase class C family)